MLNFSAGPVNVLAAMKAAQVKTILTSKAFIEKGKLGFRELEKLVLKKLGEPKPKSGKQEYLENLLNTYLH